MHKAGRCLHQCDLTIDRRKGAIGDAVVRVSRRIDRVMSTEAVARPQVDILNLMTLGAGDAIHCQRVRGMTGRSNALITEDNSIIASCIQVDSRARHRHMAGGALVLDVITEIWIRQHLATKPRAPVGVVSGVCHHRRAPHAVEGDVCARFILEVGVTTGADARCAEVVAPHRQQGNNLRVGSWRLLHRRGGVGVDDGRYRCRGRRWRLYRSWFTVGNCNRRLGSLGLFDGFDATLKVLHGCIEGDNNQYHPNQWAKLKQQRLTLLHRILPTRSAL